MALINPVKGILRYILAAIVIVIFVSAICSMSSVFYVADIQGEQVELTGFQLAFGTDKTPALDTFRLAFIALVAGAVLSLANLIGLTLFRFVSAVGAFLAIAAAVVFFLTNELCVANLGSLAYVAEDAESMFAIPGLCSGAAAAACLAGIGGVVNGLGQVLVHK